MNWEWVFTHFDLFGERLSEHVFLALTPVALGVLIALPVGLLCVQFTKIYPLVLAATSVLYAIPSIALFIFLLDYTGLGPLTAIIPLALFSLSVLVRNVVDGLRAVPESVRQAATAMGFGRARRLLQVDLPIALPVIIAGVRVATVSSISMVSIAALIGLGGLGQLFTSGFQRTFPTEIISGVALIVLLAVLCDVLLFVAGRLLAPWARDRGRVREAA